MPCEPRWCRTSATGPRDLPASSSRGATPDIRCSRPRAARPGRLITLGPCRGSALLHQGWGHDLREASFMSGSVLEGAIKVERPVEADDRLFPGDADEYGRCDICPGEITPGEPCPRQIGPAK